MAIIARVEPQENVRLNPNAPVPIGSSAYAGVEGDALENFGNSLTQLGDRQLQMSREITRKETEVEMENTLKEASLKAEMESVVGPDGRSNYQEIATKYANERLAKTASEKAGWDPRLSREFESYTKNLQRAFGVETKITQTKKQQESNNQRMTDYVNGRVMSLTEMPSEARFDAEWNDFGAMMKRMTDPGDGDPLISQEVAEEQRRTFGKRMVGGYIEGLKKLGLLSKQKNFIKQGIQTLEGAQLNPAQYDLELSPEEAYDAGYIASEEERDSLMASGENYKVPILEAGEGAEVPLSPAISEALKYVSAEEKSAMIEDLMRHLKGGTEDGFSALSDKIRDLNDLVLNYDKTPEEAIKEAEGFMSDLSQMDGVPPFRKQELVAEAATTIGIIDALREAPLMHERDFPALYAKADKLSRLIVNKNFAQLDPEALKDLGKSNKIQARIRDKIESVAKARLADMVKRREADPADFLVTASPKLRDLDLAKQADRKSLQEYSAAMKAMQERVGVKDIRLLSNAYAKEVAGELDGAKVDAEAMTRKVSIVRKEFGKFSPLMERQVAKHSKAVAAAFSLNSLPDETKIPFMNAYLNKDAIGKQFDSIPEAKKAVVESRIGRYFDQGFVPAHALANPNSHWMKQSNLLKEAVTWAVKDSVAKDPTMIDRPKDLDETVRDAYSRVVNQKFLDPRRMRYNRTSLLIPREQPNGVRLGDDEAKEIMRHVQFYSQARGLRELVKPKNDPRLQKDPDRFYNELEATTSWTVSDDGSTLILKKKDPGSIGTKTMSVNGKPVTLKIRDILNNPHQKAVEADKGFINSIRNWSANDTPDTDTLDSGDSTTTFTPVRPGGFK